MPITFSSPASREARARGHGVTAVLGPTNTGKTHLAIERMLAHSSGMIGLPLRLLAREVYNKVAERVGPDAVALITGEEKIKPANPRFWVSTVEAMPRDLDVAFLAIDEAQLGADLERGHVFTDRILNMRGREETLVLGAATLKPMVERLLPGAHVLTRPRLSQLTFAGERKLTRQPPRTAIVTFSADEVYAIAELVRRQRGGAAVVLGALSPRTRNAQVALYQSGDVDYLIATDAIGMGLNLDVDHVAFASDRKFDGYQFRRLNPAELAQVAGRAGRATRDGTFGTTGRCAPFEPEIVQALESHTFEPLKVLQWRNADLDFSSLGALAASLAAIPTEPGLTRAPIGEDILVLEHAMRDDAVRARATTRGAIERLWEACQVPDYRKISPAAHAELIVTLYGFLMGEGRIPDDWFSGHIAQADRNDGDIDTLSARIAHIRTWTFVANRADWLKDPEHWQGVTRSIEDKLSDALHERLTERFVDRRTSVLMKRLRENTMLEAEIGKSGEVIVEGHPIGRLDGFRFVADPGAAAGTEARALSAAAQKALAGEIDGRALRLSHAPDSQFVLASDGVIRWQGEPVAKLVASDNVLRPRVRILSDERLTGASLEAVQTRLDLWTRSHIERLLAPLFTLGAAEDVAGIARGIAYQIVEALGVLERQRVAEEVKGLDQAERAALRKHGVRFGAYHLYLPGLLKPAPRALAAQLWALKFASPDMTGLDDLQQLAGSGRTSFKTDKETPKALLRALGFRLCGERAVRVDILERLADTIRPALAWREGSPGEKPAGAFDGRAFTVTGAMTSLTGCAGEDFASILRSLGYRMERRLKPAPAPETVTQTAPEETPATPADAGAVPTAEIAVLEAPALDLTRGVEPDAGDQAVAEADRSSPDQLHETALSPDTTASLDESAAAAPLQGEAEPVGDAPASRAADSEGSPVTQSEAGAAEANADDAGVAAASIDEPEMIEVWRPGRFEERRDAPRRRPRHARERAPHAASPAGEAQAPAAADVAADSAAAGGEPAREDSGRDRGHDRGRRRHRRDRTAAPEGAEGAGAAAGDRLREERRGPPRKDFGGSERDQPRRGSRPERGPAHRRRERSDEDRAPRTWASTNESRRGKEPDPDSPFAKLAALKAQLEAGKERP